MPLLPCSSNWRCEPPNGYSTRFDKYFSSNSPSVQVTSRVNPIEKVSAYLPLTKSFACGPRENSVGKTAVAPMKANVVGCFAGTTAVFQERKLAGASPRVHHWTVM